MECVGDETIVYDVKTNEAHLLRPLAAAVFSEADGTASLAELTDRTALRAGRPLAVGELDDALAQLEERNLMASTAEDGLSRRQIMRRGALVGAALAVPLVSTIAAPPASAAPSCGTACTTDAQCTNAACNMCTMNPRVCD